MDAMTKKLLKGATLTVLLGKSEYGTPEPRVEVRFPAEARYRVRSAALHALAAEIEAATPATDHWCVELADGNYESGRVWLELARGTGDEAERGLALLRSMLA
jgi:hypothetical protein